MPSSIIRIAIIIVIAIIAIIIIIIRIIIIIIIIIMFFIINSLQKLLIWSKHASHCHPVLCVLVISI